MANIRAETVPFPENVVPIIGGRSLFGGLDLEYGLCMYNFPNLRSMAPWLGVALPLL